jgi:AP endonuclease 1
MTRARKSRNTAEEDPIPIRTTPRKRKLVDYTERDEEKAGQAESDEDVEEYANGTVNEVKGRKASANKPAGNRKANAAKASSPVLAVPTRKTGTSNGIIEEAVVSTTQTTKTTPGKAKPKAKSDAPATDTQGIDPNLSDSSAASTTHSPKAKRKRKTPAEKEAAMIPLASRSTNINYFIGAHTSIAKGVENAIINANHIGANSFALFLKSQRKWDNPALQPTSISNWNTTLQSHPYDMKHVVPHGSYLVNLASSDPEMSKKSYTAFLDDLQRCEKLGIKYYNFHPGAAGQTPMKEAIQRLAKNLNKALSETSTVVPLLENMATRGSIIGGKFEDLAQTIALIDPKHRDQGRIGVCIDTCHSFASGYDLRSPEAFEKTMKEFDKVVGMKYLKAVHLNDSKAGLGWGRDLHQNIGVGFLGLRAFHNIMNDARFQNIPLVLETPCEREVDDDGNEAKDESEGEASDGDEASKKKKAKEKLKAKLKAKARPAKKRTLEDKQVWATEIKLLESLIGMDAEGEEFKKLERELSEKGREEREKMQKAYDEKIAKERRKSEKAEKGQKSLKDMFGGKGKKKEAADED